MRIYIHSISQCVSFDLTWLREKERERERRKRERERKREEERGRGREREEEREREGKREREREREREKERERSWSMMRGVGLAQLAIEHVEVPHCLLLAVKEHLEEVRFGGRQGVAVSAPVFSSVRLTASLYASSASAASSDFSSYNRLASSCQSRAWVTASMAAKVALPLDNDAARSDCALCDLLCFTASVSCKRACHLWMAFMTCSC